MKKLYAKIVRERRDPFQIETSIQEQGEKKFVVKQNLTLASVEHINRMMETYNKEKNTNLLCPCFLQDNCIYFDYIEGISFAQLLLNAIHNIDYDRVRKLADKYEEILEILCKNKQKELISDDSAFIKVFGKYESNNTNNIEYGYRDLIFDLTFDNIIYQNDNPQIIDYEWRFDFPVSPDFIKFRAVYAFFMKYGNEISKMYTKESFFALFNLKENLKKYLFYNMSFIKFVYGKTSYNDILNQYRKKNKSINSLSKIEEFEKNFYCDMLQLIKKYRDLFDDYEKFFRITNTIKDQGIDDFLFNEEFYKEFHVFLKSNFDMIEFYKNQTEEKEKIINSQREEYEEIIKVQQVRIEELSVKKTNIFNILKKNR